MKDEDRRPLAQIARSIELRRAEILFPGGGAGPEGDASRDASECPLAEQHYLLALSALEQAERHFLLAATFATRAIAEKQGRR